LPADLSDEDGRRLNAALDAIPSFRLVPGWACRHGRAAGFAALDAACRLISSGAAPLVVVGGIDSLCALDTIRALVGTDRLLAPGTEGTIPGEAGMFALIADGHHAAGIDNAVSLAGLALGRSPTPFIRQQRVSADGLAATFRQLREHGSGKVDQVIGAHGGEGYFARSFSYAYLREVELMPEPLEVELIADRVGDVGAAAAVVGLAFATHFMTPGWRPGPERRVLVYSESDTGEVGAAILQGAPSTWRRPAAQPSDRRRRP
jgi:3-oxoacyl-[acyl-carrier-protein] synthase-1